MRIAIILTMCFLPLMFAEVNGQELTQNDGYYYQNGKLFTGVYEEKNESNQVVSKLSISKGLLNGESEIYDNGILVEKRNFRKGQKHGQWSKFEHGKQVSCAQFLNDKKHGKWRIWDTDGTLRYEMFYKKGKKSGVWKMWDEKGSLISEKAY